MSAEDETVGSTVPKGASSETTPRTFESLVAKRSLSPFEGLQKVCVEKRKRE